MHRHRILTILTLVLLALVLFVVAELLIIKYNGSDVPTPNIPRGEQVFGSGPALRYVVMGDSTSIGQGADYSQSYAYGSAQHLSQRYTVHLINVGVSGARAKDVLDTQLGKAVAYKPDVVLLGVGANDATHFTSGAAMEQSLQAIIDGLKKANPKLKIVVTGSPAMGSVARFPWPAKQLAGLRERQINTVFTRLDRQDHLTMAPVAAKTGPAFRADPTLFAADNFHPNTRGYALWTPVINDALDSALQSSNTKH